MAETKLCKKWHVYVRVYNEKVRGTDCYVRITKLSVISWNTKCNFSLHILTYLLLSPYWNLCLMIPQLVILQDMIMNSEWGHRKQLKPWSKPNYLVYWHDVRESVLYSFFRSWLWHQELWPNMFTTLSLWPRTYTYLKDKGHQVFVEFEHNKC